MKVQQDLLLLSKNMKSIKYILLAVVLLSVSCEQEPPTVDFGKLPVHYGYMQFSTGVSNTRAHLAESMRGRDFGVIGFLTRKSLAVATAFALTPQLSSGRTTTTPSLRTTHTMVRELLSANQTRLIPQLLSILTDG